jgi:hypothetical protein
MSPSLQMAQSAYSPGGAGRAGVGAGVGAATTHYTVLQQQWAEEQRQLRMREDPAVLRQQQLEQRERDRFKRKVDEGVAAVLCALPVRGTPAPLDDPVANRCERVVCE